MKRFKVVTGLILALLILFLLSLFIAHFYLVDLSELIQILVSNQEVHYALYLSFTTSIIAIVAAAICSLPAGYFMARYDFRGKNICESILELPIVLPPLVIGLSLLILCGPILGDALKQLGIDFVFTPSGVVLAQFTVALPFVINNFRTAFGQIDPAIEQAAMTLGDTPLEVFYRVSIPLAKEGLIAGLTMGWARAIGAFGATVMLAGSTKFKTETLPVAIFLNINTGDTEVATAIALIMIMFAGLLLLILKLISQRKLKF
ncbi:MAG: ABC transporter permease [Bacillota bacterium]